MSEELLQRDLKNPPKFGKWDFYNIGATTVKALKEYGIIRNVNYGNEERKKVDALLVQKKNVIAVIEYKKPSEFKTAEQKNKAINQELEVARSLKAPIFIATDTKETIWINVLTGNRIKDENNKELKVNFNIKDEKLPDLFEKIIASINEKNDQIKPKELVNPTDLAKRIWQIVWSISGATPESCLYSFVELFIFKYLSDLKVLEYPEDFDSLIKLYENKNPEYVIDYYARNIRRKIKEELFPKGSDGTTIINGTVFVNNDNEAIEGRSIAFEKILKEFQSYGKLENIHPDFKSKLFESFLKESISEKKWGQFFTPLKVVQAIVEMAKDDIKTGYKIGDSACGVGKFLLEAIKPRLNQFYKVEKNVLKSDIEIFGYDIGFDKDEQKTIILAKANMLIYFSELIKDNKTITTQFADLFNKSFELKKNSILGTLAVKEEEKYDLILSNPPYVTSGSSNIKEEIKRKGLSDYYKINAMGLEGLFMEWIIKALKPNGKAFIVVPDGIFNRQNDKNLRQYILNECFLDGIISLPIKTFFSTQKKTYILCITKKGNKSEQQTEPVFTYLVSEIGESRDIYRFNIEQDDLNEAVILFSQFKGAKQYFETKEKRCKIQPITKFDPNTHWSVERWWTKEEQIELGIVEENKTIKFEELPELIEDVANSILNFKEEVLQLNEKKKSKIIYKEISFTEIFDFPSIKGLTKQFIDSNKGKIPVYGGKINEEPIGFIADNLPNVKYFNNCLAWNREGSVGYVFWHKHKFTTNDHHRPILIKKEYENSLDLTFLQNLIQIVLINEGFVWSKTASKEKVERLMLKIPINSNGKFDLFIQQQIAEKHNYITELKTKIESYKKQIETLNVEVDSSFKNEILKVNDIFEVVSGFTFKKSLFTRNVSDIPIIRIQNISEKNPKYVYYPKSETIDSQFLVKEDDFLLPLSGSFFRLTKWNQKGTFYLNQRIAKFSMKPNFADRLNEQFVQTMMNTIEDKIQKMGFSANNNLRINDVKNIEIPIPINSKGEFDLPTQREIAEKYRKIEQIKKSISEELDKIASIEIKFD